MKKTLVVSLILTSALSANSLQQIKSANVIRIGIVPNNPPLSQIDKSGNFHGFEVAFARKIASAILPNGKVELVGIANADRGSAVKENRVDLLIANFARTEARAKEMSFSIPYLSTSLAVVARGDKGIKSEGDLNNRKVLTIGGTNSESYLKNKNIETVSCKNNMDCFQLLSNGSGDAYMHNILNVAVIPLLDNDYKISVKAVGPILFDCIATQKGNDALLNLVNEKILSLSKEGFFNNAYQNTFANFYKGTVEDKFFLLEDVYSTLSM